MSASHRWLLTHHDGVFTQIRDELYASFLKMSLYEDMAPWNIFYEAGKVRRNPQSPASQNMNTQSVVGSLLASSSLIVDQTSFARRMWRPATIPCRARAACLTCRLQLIYIDYDTRNLVFDEAVKTAYQVRLSAGWICAAAPAASLHHRLVTRSSCR